MPRSMEIDTPLGGDVLLFHRMRAHDELSRSSDFELELLSDSKTLINFDDILGKNVTVRVLLQDGSTRYFNGFVTRFAAAGRLGRYLRFTATVSPWAWFMTRTSDCRIFQDKTVRQILEDVFADHPMADFKFELTESYEKWTYCVQYRETDFNFVSRLMEHEGIYYYYRHIDGGHTMVLTDSIDKHECFPGYDSIKFYQPQERVRPEVEHISTWEFSRQVQPGVFSLDDYDFERPAVDLRLGKPVPRKYKPSDYEWFDYPGLFIKKGHGEQLAQVRGEEFGSQFERAAGETNARGVHVGSVFLLDGFSRADQNCKHLVVSSTHELEFSDYEAMPEQGGSSFHCKFVAMTTAQQFRPKRITPKPFVQGPQTAVVVGPGGEEIYTDKYGRVKVQFHWDSRGGNNEQSSCWIRVSHPWAGKGWGSVSTPRIGQEVIVDFLEGDPDQPIITGRVYNADNLPPFGFPAGAVISGVKSDTHKGGGFNEMSLDDTAGAERVFIHGQYNMDTVVEHDQTSTIHNCRTDRVDVDDSESIGNNQKWDVGVNRDAKIGSNETLTVGVNRTKKIGANETITVGANRTSSVGANETASVAAARTHSVGAAETISVGAAQSISVGAAQSLSVGAAQDVNVAADQSVSVGGNQSTSVGGNQGISVSGNQSVNVSKNNMTEVGGDSGLTVSGGRSASIAKDDTTSVDKNLMFDAGDSVTIKTGDASITMKKDGTISIKGKNITLEGSGKINVKASSDVVVKGSKVGIN
jgi:type VI secretion system secreted protein VgrG